MPIQPHGEPVKLAHTMSTNQPNILFIFADQMHRDAMRCMGTDDIITPNLDRLASQGTLFRSAYSNCPICTPYRVNLFTGRYTSQTQTMGNNFALPTDQPLLAQSLNDAGYRTSYIGKWHLGGAGNQPIPEELRGGFTDFIGYQCYNGFLHEVCFFDEANEKHQFNTHRTDVTTDLAIERMSRAGDQPLAMFVSYQAPHYPVQPSYEYEQMYAGVKIKRRPNCQDVDPYTPTFSPPSPRPIENCPDHRRYGNDLDEYLRLYYAMVTQIDANVGRLLDELEASGKADNTLVIFTADHGDMQGSLGRINKCLPYEESAGVPLIVRAPRSMDMPTGEDSSALVSGIDYYPTMLDLAGVQPHDFLPGRSILPLLDGNTDDGRPVFSEFRDWRMVRDGDLKLVTGDQESEYEARELYDLKADPFEMNNCLATADSEQVSKLRKQIVDWQGMCLSGS